MKIEELEKELKQGILRSIYLLYGEEKFLLETSLKSIKRIFGERIAGINYITLYENNIGEIISDLETPAFGFDKKLIIVKNSGLLKKDTKRKTKDNKDIIKKKLNEYINENIDVINESVVLIFIEDEAEKCELLSTIDKLGVVCKFDYQKPFQIQARLSAILKAYNVKADNQTIMYLIESCGTNMQELINEIRKLIEYAGAGNTINKEDIDMLSTKNIESIIFDLTDNLGKKKTKEAIEVLRNLIIAKEPMQKILITLYNHFKKLYLCKYAISINKDVSSSLNLKANQMFLVNKYRAQANYFKINELRTILQQLCDLDYKYKIGKIDLNIGLESILCTYM